jgi:D-alanine-D-alanine ligase
MRIALLYNRVGETAGEDDRDILVQAEAVSDALRALHHETVRVEFTLDLPEVKKKLHQGRPRLVFNLADSLQGEGEFIHFAPAMLEHLRLPYTGCPADSVYLTSNKLIAKKLMRLARIPTPDWVDPARGGSRGQDPGGRRFGAGVQETPAPGARGAGAAGRGISPPCTIVLKSIWEHASAGLDAGSVHEVGSTGEVAELIRQAGNDFFAERYIDGREFNISLLSCGGSVQLLEPAEMLFIDFPEHTPKILGYDAKWKERSEEYARTQRSFGHTPSDAPLLDRMREIALECWSLFNLNGYARVDFRVDGQGNPFVLEINANPCISPDSGFTAAAGRSGMTYTDMIGRIVENGAGYSRKTAGTK